MKKFYIMLLVIIVLAVAFFSMNVLETQAPGVIVDSGVIDSGTDTYTDTHTNSGSGRVRAPEDVTLKVGESKLVMGELTLTLNALVNDYRCPTDVVCIEAGAVNTNITVSDGTETVTQNYSSDGVPGLFLGYNISITDVTPQALSTKPIAPSEYAVTFRVESSYAEIVDTVPAGDTGSQCASMGGTWDGEHRECLGVDASMCTEIGGSWNECASACRHDPTAEVCTMQCVLVCQFK
jgi:hypothetical protein